MDKLKMQTANKADENYRKLAELFPNAVTETIDGNGNVVRAIDKDVLMQEISAKVVDGREERYQFTWPDKKKSVLLANAPISKTLRPCREESVDFDHTGNLYIEGDNLEALKLLQETYLGKIKMIYIDPPYNTGNDFVYNDDFAQSTGKYLASSGQFDEDGNRMVQNTESNGRFHTDWLNMIYPRLKLAKDLLTDDGVIFISIDDNEATNLIKCCGEIFGQCNFVAQIPWRKRTAKSDVPYGISQDYEYVICFAKSEKFTASIEGKERKYYETPDFEGRPWRVHDLTKQTTASERPNSYFTIVNPKTGEEYPANPNRTWAITEDTFKSYYAEDRIVFPGDYAFLNIQKPVLRYWKEDDMKKAGDKFGRIAVSTRLPDNIGMSQDGTKEITTLLGVKAFSFPKPSSLLKYLISVSIAENDYILDFFSGSATTAHAVMQLNAEDGGHRKFIMVQLPEATDKKSEAYKAGYKNICEIGKERIRRAGGKIKAEHPVAQLDTGFRVFRVDESNMEDVYYHPKELTQTMLGGMVSNIKSDRSDLDLLYACLLDWGVEINLPHSSETLDGCTIHNVDNGALVACFNENVPDTVIRRMADLHPIRAVFRDSSFVSDDNKINVTEIFKNLSPDTNVKVI